MPRTVVDAVDGCFRRLDEGPKEAPGRFLGLGSVMDAG